MPWSPVSPNYRKRPKLPSAGGAYRFTAYGRYRSKEIDVADLEKRRRGQRNNSIILASGHVRALQNVPEPVWSSSALLAASESRTEVTFSSHH